MRMGTNWNPEIHTLVFLQIYIMPIKTWETKVRIGAVHTGLAHG